MIRLLGVLVLLLCGLAGAQQVTLATIYGNTPENADLVALRDGPDGPWQAIPGEHGRYTFTVESGVFSLAILCFSPWGPQAAVYTFTPTELPFLQHVCLADVTAATAAEHPKVTLSGMINGITPRKEREAPELVRIAAGRESMYLFDQQYSLSVQAETPLDLIVLRTRIGHPEAQALLLRGLQLTEDTQLDLDFDGPEVLVLQQHEIRLPDTTPSALFAELRTCNGTFISLENQQYPLDPSQLTYLAFPASARRACDRYELAVLASAASNAGAGSDDYFFRRFTSTPHDEMITLPEPAPEPCLKRDTSGTALQVDWEAQTEVSFYFFALYSDGVGWSMLRSAHLPPGLELPLISELPGWPEMLDVAGKAFDWSLSAFSSSAGVGAAIAMMQRLFAFEADIPDIVPDGAELRFSSRDGLLPAGTVVSCPTR